jgi:8-oxo-dGTP pyrophosphatase MutT (NUDIX family)
MNNILVDVDDTLNDMTGDMCVAFDPKMKRLTFDQILRGEIPEGFATHRLNFLNQLENWSCPPSGVGAMIIDNINKRKQLKAVICTKTPTKVGSFQVATEKVKFQQEHYPNTDTLIVVGDKSVVPARGIIDDLTGNCLKHNGKHGSAYLVFEHGRTTEEHLKMFMEMCTYKPVEGQHAALVVAKYNDQIVKFMRKNGDEALPCGKVDMGETYEEAARREFWEETGIQLHPTEPLIDYGTMTTKTGWKVGVFYVDLSERSMIVMNQPKEFVNEGHPFLCDDPEVGEEGDENYEFNNILMHNLKLN